MFVTRVSSEVRMMLALAEPLFAVYTLLESGEEAIDFGAVPTVIDLEIVLLIALITVTAPQPESAT